MAEPIKGRRFEILFKQGTVNAPEILVDMETGVEYLAMTSGGITPLIDRDGKPVIAPFAKEQPQEGCCETRSAACFGCGIFMDRGIISPEISSCGEGEQQIVSIF